MPLGARGQVRHQRGRHYRHQCGDLEWIDKEEGLNGGASITLNTYFFDCITLNS